MPHGHCFFWRPEILWPFVATNLAITGAYVVGFPWAFYPWLYRNGESLPAPAAVVLALFVALCGLGHAFVVANVWLGRYAEETVWHLLTAVVSWLFVVVVRVGARRYHLAPGPTE